MKKKLRKHQGQFDEKIYTNWEQFLENKEFFWIKNSVNNLRKHFDEQLARKFEYKFEQKCDEKNDENFEGRKNWTKN